MKTTTKGIIVVAVCIALLLLFGVFTRLPGGTPVGPALIVFLGVGIYLIVRGMRSRTPSPNV